MKLFIHIRNIINHLIQWVYTPFRKFIPPETFRYAVTGGANTLLDIFLYFICYHYVLNEQIINFGFVAISPHIAAFLIVFPITFLTGFLLAKYITFTSSPIKGRTQLLRYMITVAGAIILNYILLKILVEYLYIWPTVSKIIITVIVVIYSYMMQRYFTFRTGTMAKKTKGQNI